MNRMFYQVVYNTAIYFILFILWQYFTIYTRGVPVFITSVITVQMCVTILVIIKKYWISVILCYNVQNIGVDGI